MLLGQQPVLGRLWRKGTQSGWESGVMASVKWSVGAFLGRQLSGRLKELAV